MRRRNILALLLALTLLLPGCGGARTGGGEEARLTILASTYPVYLAARAVTDGVDGVAVERLNTGEVSCLHDYTLTVTDMKKIETADIIALNGADLEEFMEDALAASSALVIDCSEGVSLLENADHVHTEGDDGHDHGHYDPHYWMDPDNMAQVVENLYAGLNQADPDHQEQYRENAINAMTDVSNFGVMAREILSTALEENGVELSGLVTFHDGFRYFAQFLDVPLLASIEEEEGSEASAKEINEITALVKEYNLPVIFTEVNGSDATAQAISRETGCAVAQLTMLMDGPDGGTLSDDYCGGLMENIRAIVNGFAGEEVLA